MRGCWVWAGVSCWKSHSRLPLPRKAGPNYFLVFELIGKGRHLKNKSKVGVLGTGSWNRDYATPFDEGSDSIWRRSQVEILSFLIRNLNERLTRVYGGVVSLVHMTMVIRRHQTPTLYLSKSMRILNLCTFNKLSLNTKIKAFMAADPDKEDIKETLGAEWAIQEEEEGVASLMDGEVEAGVVVFLTVAEATVSFTTKLAKEVKVVKAEVTTRGTRTTMGIAVVDEVQEDTMVVSMAILMAQRRHRRRNLQQLSQQGQHK